MKTAIFTYDIHAAGYAFSQAQTAHLEMARRIKSALEDPRL